MNRSLLLLFNHTLTKQQKEDAVRSLCVSRIEHPPDQLQRLWRAVPPELETIKEYLKPIAEWILNNAHTGDFILIQGDFGATWLMVKFSMEQGLIPIYSTTERDAVEEIREDGSIKLSHRFIHARFRKYGV